MQKRDFFESPLPIMILMIIILLLIFISASYGNMGVLKPTGNVDIYDIVIESKCDNEDCDKCDEPGTDKDEGKLSIFDSNGEFSRQESLKIFSNPAFEMEEKIAPGSSNAYQFVVRNVNDFDIAYGIKMSETNEYGINIKYRLKNEEKYIIGDKDEWVTADKLVIEKDKLTSKEYETYVLEWKWFESDRDTEIGKIDNANYKLSMQVVAKSI